MILIMSISSRVREIMTILIIGIMLSSGISAIVTIMQYFSAESMLKAYVIWTMGSLGNLTSDQLNVLLICVSAGILLSLSSAKMLNAISLGENYATSIGLNVKLSRASNICIDKHPGRQCDSILRTHRIYWNSSASYFQDPAQNI